MAFTEKEYFSQQATTSATSAYSPAASTISIIKSITVCNHEATSQTFGIWVDADGSTYDDNSVRFEDTPIDANTTVVIDVYWIMDNAAGNIAIKADANSKITISACGADIT